MESVQPSYCIFHLSQNILEKVHSLLIRHSTSPRTFQKKCAAFLSEVPPVSEHSTKSVQPSYQKFHQLQKILKVHCLAATLPSFAILYFLFTTISIGTIIVFEYQYLHTCLLMQRSISGWMSRQSWQFSIFSVNLEPHMSKQHWSFWLHIQLFQRSGRREKLSSRWHWSQIEMGLKRFLYQLECNFLQTWCINGICVLRSMHPH